MSTPGRPNKRTKDMHNSLLEVETNDGCDKYLAQILDKYLKTKTPVDSATIDVKRN